MREFVIEFINTNPLDDSYIFDGQLFPLYFGYITILSEDSSE